MIWLTSDTHFGDNRFQLFYRKFKSVEEQDNYFIKVWNETVKPEDKVICLGDFAVPKEGLLQASKLNGHKILVRGNYDEQFTDDELLKYFDSVHPELKIKMNNETFYLNHYPTKGKSNMFNIVGHIHSLWKVQRNMVNVGLDAWNYQLVSKDELLFAINAIRKFYDANVFAGQLDCNKQTTPTT